MGLAAAQKLTLFYVWTDIMVLSIKSWYFVREKAVIMYWNLLLQNE